MYPEPGSDFGCVQWLVCSTLYLRDDHHCLKLYIWFFCWLEFRLVDKKVCRIFSDDPKVMSLLETVVCSLLTFYHGGSIPFSLTLTENENPTSLVVMWIRLERLLDYLKYILCVKGLNWQISNLTLKKV